MMTTITTLQDAVLFDMDGTLCDVRGIRHLVTGETRNFHAFHEQSVNCPPNQWVVDATHETHRNGQMVVIVTARDAKFYQHTLWWMMMNNVYFDDMFMRRMNDQRPDYIVKKEILVLIRERYNPVHAWDDNPAIIQLWTEEGIPTTIVEGFGFDGKDFN